MLKRSITYKDFNDQMITEDFYFNLSKSELVELEFEKGESFGDRLRKIVNTRDNPGLVTEFKRLILLAYGEKSDDGKRFVKNDTLREEFSQTAAYQELFVEMATNEDVLLNFIKGIMPADMSAGLDQAIAASEQMVVIPTPTQLVPPAPVMPFSTPPSNT